MEEKVSLGGRSTSTGVVSNASTDNRSETGPSPRGGGQIAGVDSQEQVEGPENELGGINDPENAESSFSGELSAGRTPRDQVAETSDNTGTPRDQAGETDDITGLNSESPDVNTEERPPTQKSFTDADQDRQPGQQKELVHNVESGNQSPQERLSTSRQSESEDALSEIKDTDAQSADVASVDTTVSQSHASTGSIAGCGCEQVYEPANNEVDTNSCSDEVVVTTPVVFEETELHASLESFGKSGKESRLTNQTEPNLEDVGNSLSTAELECEELGRKVLRQCCQRQAVEEVLPVESPEEPNHLKAEINALQTRLDTLIRDNNEKGMRIVDLETNLLEMTSKLLNAEKKCLPLELASSRRETNKSRTCAIL